jgi:hypothetical protein
LIISPWLLSKTPIFRQKLAKIADNCDHNIDPRYTTGPRRQGTSLF